METQNRRAQSRSSSTDPIAAVPLWPVLPLAFIAAGIAALLLEPLLPPELTQKARWLATFASIVMWWLWVVAGATRRAGFRPSTPSTGAVLKASKVAIGGILATTVWVLLKNALGLTRVGLMVPASVVSSEPTAQSLALTVLQVGLLAPAAEEMLFRGALFRKWRLRLGPARAALVTSVLFGLMHVNPPASILFALSMAVLYTTTRTIWAPVAAHVLNNLFSVTLLGQSERLLPAAVLEAAAHWPLQLALLVPSLLGTWWLVRFVRRSWHTLGDPVDGVQLDSGTGPRH